MEFMATGWCTGKWLRLYETIRNLTSGKVGILLMVIWLGVTGLKKIRLVYLLEGKRGEGAVLFSVYGAHKAIEILCYKFKNLKTK